MVLLVEVALLVWKVVLLRRVYVSKNFRLRQSPHGGCPWVDLLMAVIVIMAVTVMEEVAMLVNVVLSL